MSETVDMRGARTLLWRLKAVPETCFPPCASFLLNRACSGRSRRRRPRWWFFGLMAYLFLQQPERTTLYASLPENEKARIVDALKNANVDVALDPSSGEVLVPTNDFHRSRILLAAQGLPASCRMAINSLKTCRWAPAGRLKICVSNILRN